MDILKDLFAKSRWAIIDKIYVPKSLRKYLPTKVIEGVGTRVDKTKLKKYYE